MAKFRPIALQGRLGALDYAWPSFDRSDSPIENVFRFGPLRRKSKKGVSRSSDRDTWVPTGMACGFGRAMGRGVPDVVPRSGSAGFSRS